MALVSIIDELQKARREGYAIPSFNAFDLLGAEGIIAALEEKKAPGILAIYTGVLEQPSAHGFIAGAKALAEGAKVPVSLFLDHGGSFAHCIKALRYGFSDVMFDGSKLPLEENIARTRAVAEAGHAVGVGVEAEIGHVGDGSSYQSFGAQQEGFTDPESVERFVEETGVDLLAIAIGTAHGQYEGEPQLALDLLAQIRERVEVPLVLHGGSGLADEQFRAAVAGGICKINIFTALALEARDRMVEACGGEKVSYFGLTGQLRAGVKARCEDHLDLFGTTGKAGDE